jgi:hypothetical protein
MTDSCESSKLLLLSTSCCGLQAHALVVLEQLDSLDLDLGPRVLLCYR